MNPDYKDWAPRIGLAYSLDAKTVVRAATASATCTSTASAAPTNSASTDRRSIIGTINQASPLKADPILHHHRTADSRPASPVAQNFNPGERQHPTFPKDTRWPYVQTWFLGGAARSSATPYCSNSPTPATTARACRSSPITTRPLPNAPGQTAGHPGAPSRSGLRRHHLGRPGRHPHLQRTRRPRRAPLRARPLLAQFLHLVESPGRFRTGARIRLRPLLANPQNIYNLAAGARPLQLRRDLLNTTSVVYQLPFGKGPQVRLSWNPVLDGAVRRLGSQPINTANTGTAAQRGVYAHRRQRCHRPHSRLSRRGRHAPERDRLPRPPTSDQPPTLFRPLAFPIPSASAPFGNSGRNAYRTPSFQADLGSNKPSRIRENISLQFRSEFFNLLNHTNLGIPDSTITDAAFGTIRRRTPRARSNSP